MANRSTFVAPDYIPDSFPTLYDLPPEKYANAQRLQTLMAKSNKSSDEITEMNNLIVELKNYYISPETFNKFTDCIYNMESNFIQIYNDFITNFTAQINKFDDKGSYDNVTTYQKWNTVVYNYEIYISLEDNNLNHQPDISTTWWRKIAQRGEKGIGIGLTPMGIYNNATTYIANQAVSYNGDIWYATQTTTGNTPSDGSAYWALFQSNMSLVIQTNQPSGLANGQVWIEIDNGTTIKNGNFRVFNGTDFDKINLTTTALDVLINDTNGLITAENAEDAFQEAFNKMLNQSRALSMGGMV